MEVSHFDKLLGGSEAADAERQQDPPTGVAAFRWILGQLFANLAVNFIPGTETSSLLTYKYTVHPSPTDPH